VKLLTSWLWWRARRDAYRSLWETDHGKVIALDMYRWARVDGALFEKDPRVEAMRLGRREAYLRFKKFARFTDDQVAKLDELERLKGQSK